MNAPQTGHEISPHPANGTVGMMARSTLLQGKIDIVFLP